MSLITTFIRVGLQIVLHAHGPVKFKKYLEFPAKEGKIIQQDKKRSVPSILQNVFEVLWNTTNRHLHMKEHHHNTYLPISQSKKSSIKGKHW